MQKLVDLGEGVFVKLDAIDRFQHLRQLDPTPTSALKFALDLWLTGSSVAMPVDEAPYSIHLLLR